MKVTAEEVRRALKSTERAFVPRLVVDIYKAKPLLSLLMKHEPPPTRWQRFKWWLTSWRRRIFGEG